MKITIMKHVYDLYEKNHLDFDVSLRWIMGYVRDDYMNQLICEEIALNSIHHIDISIEDEIINRIKLKSHEDLSKTVNLLLLTAFFLGGSE